MWPSDLCQCLLTPCRSCAMSKFFDMERYLRSSDGLAGDIHDDAPSWGGRPSPPRARPGTAVGRIVASSSKRGHAPATGDHFAGPKNWLPTLGPVPNGASRTPLRGATMAGPASSWHPHAPCHTYCTGPAANQPVGHGVTVMQRVPQQAWLVRHTTRHDTVSRHIEPV